MNEHYYHGTIDAGAVCTRCEQPPWDHPLGFIYYTPEIGLDGVRHLGARFEEWPDGALDYLRRLDQTRVMLLGEEEEPPAQ